MVGELKLDQIWHVRKVGATEENWEFSVNYKVPIEDHVLRGLLQGETKPPLRIADYPDLLRLVRVLVAEIRRLTEAPVEMGEAGYFVRAYKQLDRLMRKPTSPNRAKVLICVGDVVGPGGRKLQEFQREFRIDELSSPSRDAVYGLDRLGSETCYRIFGEKAGSLAGYPPEAIPTHRRASAFLAYRRTHDAEAKQLYDVLSQMGSGTLFEPYIDHHDMQPGNWQDQIFHKIESADVFVALVSSDYAESGTVGLQEFERAKQVAGRKQWDDFFAPVFVGETVSAAGVELRQFDGFEARTGDDISVENKALDRWLGRVASVGMSRDSE